MRLSDDDQVCTARCSRVQTQLFSQRPFRNVFLRDAFPIAVMLVQIYKLRAFDGCFCLKSLDNMIWEVDDELYGNLVESVQRLFLGAACLVSSTTCGSGAQTATRRDNWKQQDAKLVFWSFWSAYVRSESVDKGHFQLLMVVNSDNVHQLKIRA